MGIPDPVVDPLPDPALRSRRVPPEGGEPRWGILAAALTPLPLWVGMLASPAWSLMSEALVLTALALGVAVGSALLALVLRASRAGQTLADAFGRRGRVLALGLSAGLFGLVGGVSTWWAAEVLGEVGPLAPLPLAVRVAAVLAVGWGVGHLYRRGHVGPLLLTAAVAVVGWGGVAVQVPWLYHLTTPLGMAVVPVGDKAVAQSAAFMTQLYWSRFADLASLGAASVMVVIPFFAAPGPKPASRFGRRRRGGRGAPIAIAATFGAAALGLMALGTELAGVGFGNPAQAALHAVGRAAVLAVVAGAVGLVAVMSTLAGGMWRRPALGATATASALLVAAFMALTLFQPDSVAQFRAPLPWPNRLVNAQTGVLAAAYIVAPWLGVLLARQVRTRHRARMPVPFGREHPAGPIAAWLAGLLVSLPFMQGFARWAGGPWLHRWVPGIAAHWTLWFWVPLEPGQPDVALAVGMLAAGVIYGGGHALGVRWRRH